MLTKICNRSGVGLFHLTPYFALQSYSLYDKFNLYSSDRSLCPLCLCGSFHALVRNTVS